MAQKTALSTIATPGQTQNFTEKAAASTGTGVPSIICEPLLFNLHIDPLTLDVFVQPLRSLGIDPLILDARVDPLALDVYIQPLRIRCDD